MAAEEREQIEDRILSSADFEEVGRFQFIPASENMPAVLLDTASGCLEIVEPMHGPHNTRVMLVRKYADDVVGQSDPTLEFAPVQPNTAPPQRCEIPE